MRSFLVVITAVCCAACAAHDRFHLEDGDRVVFFGDSITEQHLYTTFVETYSLTRFPERHVTFVNSGWGGERVTGGLGGGIVERLARDVLAYRPDVVTILLGMNDGRYRAFDAQLFGVYSNGYREIIKRLKAARPGVRITVIHPSPYDDVTREPGFPGGYNAVMLRYGDFVRELAAAEDLTVADFNHPVTATLARAKASHPMLSQQIIPDRVHPGAAGNLIMAGALLKAWHAPAVVSAIDIDAAAKRVVKSENTSVSGMSFESAVTWTQTDEALPAPVDRSDAATNLALASSDFQETLNRQTLRVTGLGPGDHTLGIDGDEVATFTAPQLAEGVNLADFKTPMWAQAAQLHALTLKHNAVHFTRWRRVQVPLPPLPPEGLETAPPALDALEADLIRQQRAVARPQPHRFELVPGDSTFRPIFNSRDLTGWHISQVNHNGSTSSWEVEDRAITGTQDKPGHGGILLTDGKYRDFEVALEVKPDYGCEGGLFLRSTEKGEAYEIPLDYRDGGTVGGISGERLEGLKGFAPQWQDILRPGEWTLLRARIEGETPRIQVWLNGIKITDWRDTQNRIPGGAADGMIALQVHGGNRWIPGGKHRFRNISVRELP